MNSYIYFILHSQYGHWCNTCKNFKPHFINFAQRVHQIASDQNKHVGIFSISCHPNRRLCRRQTSSGYPVVRLFKPGATEGMDIPFMDINPVKALEKMGMVIDTREFEDDWDIPVPAANRYPKWQQILDELLGREREVRPYHRRTRDELKSDIHLSLDFALRDGVYSTDSPISEKASTALKEWLKLLHKTLPESWEVHLVIEELLANFVYITKHEGYLTRVLDQHPPENVKWSEACSHGDPDAGYTCGLWELFHAMTIGVVRHNMINPEHRRIATEDAATTLRNYVENFFGCIECRNNFLATADSCAFDRCTRLGKDVQGIAKNKEKDWAQLPLWLFEVHNDVNVRLVKEKAVRENRIATKKEEIAALWPIKEECLPCWNSQTRNNNATWDKTSVYSWMQLEYGQLDSSTVALRKELQQMTLKTERKLKRKKRVLKTTYGSAIAAFGFAAFMCVKVQRRLVTGRHKKVEDGPDEPHYLPQNQPVKNRVLHRKIGNN
jgi:Erv1 / Alr family/Thioredoxin